MILQRVLLIVRMAILRLVLLVNIIKLASLVVKYVVLLAVPVTMVYLAINVLLVGIY
jgi:hypothetical protein